MSAGVRLQTIYATLRHAFGHRNWWPARNPFEVVVGAVLTQNTNWGNVERVISNLRGAGMLSPVRLADADPQRLQELVRPAGYYRQKAARLIRLCRWVRDSCGGDDVELSALKKRPSDSLREELLSLNGIGPETADSVLLYALEKPVFVVDAYTVRVMGRHGLVGPDSSYADVQAQFQEALPPDVELFKDFHAQFVEVGKKYCKKRGPGCAECPLHPVLGDPEAADAAP